ncbi:MAG: LCP family protein [Eubacteriales bacterium]|nr:LCP family protein [Eubacteriales bacterium]
MKKLVKWAAALFALVLLVSAPAYAQEESGAQTKISNTYNILLIGVDRRDDSWSGNSDVMILVTVNYDKKAIYLTSFLRDLYADIPGIGVEKLNAACANGGAKLCVETIESNYNVQIDNYAMVDFNSMIAVVDAIGGIDMEITEDERNVANDYIRVMCESNGEPASEHTITQSGQIHMDGYQAVGFSRNRYSGQGSDFGRTERQRKVLNAIFDELKSNAVASAVPLMESVLSYVDHDISYLKMVKLLAQAPEVLEYDVVQQHIPYDDMYYSQNEILIPTDMQETIAKLQETIYG